MMITIDGANKLVDERKESKEANKRDSEGLQVNYIWIYPC
jgi:hypothetical protein